MRWNSLLQVVAVTGCSPLPDGSGLQVNVWVVTAKPGSTAGQAGPECETVSVPGDSQTESLSLAGSDE